MDELPGGNLEDNRIVVCLGRRSLDRFHPDADHAKRLAGANQAQDNLAPVLGLAEDLDAALDHDAQRRDRLPSRKMN